MVTGTSSVDTSRDVRRLLDDVLCDLVVEWVVPIVLEDRVDAFLDVHVCSCCELSCDIDVSMSSHCLDCYPGVWILLETGIEYDV